MSFPASVVILIFLVHFFGLTGNAMARIASKSGRFPRYSQTIPERRESCVRAFLQRAADRAQDGPELAVPVLPDAMDIVCRDLLPVLPKAVSPLPIFEGRQRFPRRQYHERLQAGPLGQAEDPFFGTDLGR